MQNTKGVKCLDHVPTAAYCAVLDGHGEMRCGIGDMDALDHVTPQWVEQHADKLQNSSIVLMDGNISLETMKTVCQLCEEKSIQGIFRGPSLVKCNKIDNNSCSTMSRRPGLHLTMSTLFTF